jgi:hypothetical protein
VVPEIPEALDAAVMKCLARDPDERYATAAQMADALEEAGGAIGIASARAVGAFVKEIAGPRIETLHAAARAAGGDASTSAVRPVTRTKLPTDPERTTVRDEQARPMELPPGASGSVPPQGLTMSSLPVAHVRQSNALLYLILALVGVFALLGAAAVLLFLRARNAQELPRVTVTNPSQGALPSQDTLHQLHAQNAVLQRNVGTSEDAGTVTVRTDAGTSAIVADNTEETPSQRGRHAGRSGRTGRAGNEGSRGRSAAHTEASASSNSNHTGPSSTQPFNPEAM